MKRDLSTSADVVQLVDTFYGQVRADAILGPIFDEVARVDWERHLPKMYAFWESVLFGTPGFKGNPLAAHRELAQRTPLTSADFCRWLELFRASVDGLFAGPMAEEARERAQRIATVMQHAIAHDALSDEHARR
jgi:hemoglobin